MSVQTTYLYLYLFFAKLFICIFKINDINIQLYYYDVFFKAKANSITLNLLPRYNLDHGEQTPLLKYNLDLNKTC